MAMFTFELEGFTKDPATCSHIHKDKDGWHSVDLDPVGLGSTIGRMKNIHAVGFVCHTCGKSFSRQAGIEFIQGSMSEYSTKGKLIKAAYNYR